MRALALVVAGAVAGAAIADARVVPRRHTLIASPPPGIGAVADAPTQNASWSRDGRAARMLAFDSHAETLVPGDRNGLRDVFVMRRGRREGDVGGPLRIASVSSSGAQANGESRLPALSGERGIAPRCVVFESRATNLSRADRSPDWDVYLRDLRRRRTILVSPGRRDARSAGVDGRCEFVTFESRGRVYVRDVRARRTLSIARGTNPSQQTNGKGVAYERGRHIHHRAFQKVRTRRGRKLRRRGREVLVSRGPRGRGNGVSRNPSMDDNGFYVAFESTATNLCGRSARWCRGVRRDGNGRTSDAFRATISRRAPTRDRMQMVSYSHAVRAQGNGPSNNPSLSSAGQFAFFDSAATNLRESRRIRNVDPNGRVRDVYNWNFPRGRGFGNVSRESRPDPKGFLDGPSVRPAASARGNYVAFESWASNAPGDGNGPGVGDIFVRFLGGK